MDPIEGDLTLLRGLVARELETINMYRGLATECADPVTKAFILHVVDEEKVHIADTLRAIAVLDLDQAGLLQTGFADGHAPGQIPVRPQSVSSGNSSGVSESDRPSAALSTDDARMDVSTSNGTGGAGQKTVEGWTVGSLRGHAQFE